MRSVSGRLGRRLLARSGSHDRENGVGLARSVAAKHRPATLARVNRLAIGRTIRPAEAHRQAEAGSEPATSRPAHMSQFAFDWIFGDGPPQGVPYAGGGALAREEAEAPAGPAATPAAGPAGPPRPPGAEHARIVEEIPPRYRLSRTAQPERAAPPTALEAKPSAEEPVVDEGPATAPPASTPVPPDRPPVALRRVARTSLPEPPPRPAARVSRPARTADPSTLVEAVPSPEPTGPPAASPGPIRRLLRRITGGAESRPAETPPTARAEQVAAPAPPRLNVAPTPAPVTTTSTAPSEPATVEDGQAQTAPSAAIARQIGPSQPATDVPLVAGPDPPPASPADPTPTLARQPVELPPARPPSAPDPRTPIADPEPPAAAAPGAPAPARWRLARAPSAERTDRSEVGAALPTGPAETAGGQTPAGGIAPDADAPAAPGNVTQTSTPGPADPIAAEPVIARAPDPVPEAPPAPAAPPPRPAPPRTRLARAPATAGTRPVARIGRRAAHDDPAPPARPPLRLVRAGEESGPVPAPRRPVSRTTGTGLMRHVAGYGAGITDDGAGAATVIFPPPPGAIGGPDGGAIARSFLGDAIGAVSHVAEAAQPFIPDAAATNTDLHARAPSAAQPSGGPGTDMEEIYEGVVDRLRRDILAERERMGDLIGDLLK